jgi:hypothetical protein
MSATWCDSSLGFQETLVREALDSLAKDLDLIEQSVALTVEVNDETRDVTDEDSYDANLPQKIERFREYLALLRAGVAQLKEIQR